MYGQLPDYDEFQGYDLVIGSELSQTAEKIYADIYKPSRGDIATSFISGGNTEGVISATPNSSGK